MFRPCGPYSGIEIDDLKKLKMNVVILKIFCEISQILQSIKIFIYH